MPCTCGRRPHFSGTSPPPCLPRCGRAVAAPQGQLCRWHHTKKIRKSNVKEGTRNYENKTGKINTEDDLNKERFTQRCNKDSHAHNRAEDGNKADVEKNKGE